MKPARPRFKFFNDTVAELKKVTWPTRKQTINLTIIVIIVSIAVGLFLGAIDAGFAALINQVFLR